MAPAVSSTCRYNLGSFAWPPQVREKQGDALTSGEQKARRTKARVGPFSVARSSQRDTEVSAPPGDAPLVVRYLGPPLGVIARELAGVCDGGGRLIEAVALDEQERE